MNPKKTKEPFFMASEALDLLFRQARGLPEVEFPPRSYDAAPTPRAPAYEPVEGGDPDAIQEYAWLICRHVENLNSLIAAYSKFLLPVSRTRFTWPILKSEHPLLSQDEKDILTRLKVGKGTGDYFDRFSKWKPDGKIALLVDELRWWVKYCKQKSTKSEPVSICPIVCRSIYDHSEVHPLVAMLRKHLEPRESEAARLNPLKINFIAEWENFVRALLDGCFNDRHCAEFLRRDFVTAKSRKQERGYSRAKSYLIRVVLKRLKALVGDK